MKKPPKRTIFDCTGMLSGGEVDLFVPKGYTCMIRVPMGQFKLVKVAEKSSHKNPTMESFILPRPQNPRT